jgi:hypothetical protein
MRRTLILLFGCLSMVGLARAQTPTDAADYPVALTEGKAHIRVTHGGGSVKIQRIQDPEFELKGYFFYCRGGTPMSGTWGRTTVVAGQ